MKTMTDAEKQEFIEFYYTNNYEQEKMSIDDKELYYELVEEGLAKDWEIALVAKGYGCFGETYLYDADWGESFRCISKLAERSGDACHYGNLGFIHYNGFLNNGIPQYEEALKCFTLGAICEDVKSEYLLSDMFRLGCGVPQNDKACYELISKAYFTTRDWFDDGMFGWDFADTAFRMGMLCENAIYSRGTDYESAYYYYLEALTGSKWRITGPKTYGVQQTHQEIKEALNRIEKKLPDHFFETYVEMDEPETINSLLYVRRQLELNVVNINGRTFIQAKCKPDQYVTGYKLITVPRLKYCKRVNKTGVYVKNPISIIGGNEDNEHYMIDDLYFNSESSTWNFMHNEDIVLSIKCDGFIFEGDVDI